MQTRQNIIVYLKLLTGFLYVSVEIIFSQDLWFSL